MRTTRVLLLAALVLVLCLSAGGDRGVQAQTSTGYNLEWHVIGGGGGPVSSAHYVVNATIGQGAASPPVSVSASYAVSGGYWFGGGFYVYLPLVLRAGH